MSLSRDVVDALYRALLGRPADEAAMRAWADANSVEEAIAGFARTAEFARRVESLSAMATHANAASMRAASLARTRGLTSIGESEPWVATRWLATMPWDALGAAGRLPTVSVLGPYARELAIEAERRGRVASARAGLEEPIGGYRATQDVLVLTEFDYLATIMASRIDLVIATRRRLLCPAPAPMRDRGERAAILASARLSMHEAGFVEVAMLTRLRLGGGTVVHDVSHAAAQPGRLLQVQRSASPEDRSSCAWLVGDRVPRHQR